MQHQSDISLRPSEEQSLRRSEPDGPIRVVVIGAGFAGLSAAQSLSHMQVALTVIDQRNHHLFQPLLYQVATAGLSPADIATPIRSLFSGRRIVRGSGCSTTCSLSPPALGTPISATTTGRNSRQA